MYRNFQEMVNELISCIAVCAYIMIGIIDLRNGMDLRNKGYEPRTLIPSEQLNLSICGAGGSLSNTLMDSRSTLHLRSL